MKPEEGKERGEVKREIKCSLRKDSMEEEEEDGGILDEGIMNEG